MIDPDTWRGRAACRGLWPSLFYSEDPRDEAKAKSICAGCDVVGACEEAGRGEPDIWGGLTERERAVGVRLVRRGPAPVVASEDLVAVLRAADPGRPALAQLLAVTPVGTSTAYRYLDQALRHHGDRSLRGRGSRLLREDNHGSKHSGHTSPRRRPGGLKAPHDGQIIPSDRGGSSIAREGEARDDVR